MKTTASCFLMLIALMMAPLIANASLHHNLQVVVSPSEQQIRVVDTLTLVSAEDDWPEGYRLMANAVIEGIRKDQQPLDYVFKNGYLKITSKIRTSDKVTITYHAICDDQLPASTVGIEDPSYGVSTTITPQGSFLSSGSAWLPVAEGWLATHDVRISAPPGLVGVTSGKFIQTETRKNQTISTWQNRIPQENLALALGHYQIQRDSLGEIQLLAFFTAQNASLAADYLAACRDYLTFYQELFGPYPYDKFAVVENFYPTGYGLPGWTLLGSSVIRLPFILTTSLPHEITHAWWGNAVEVDYATGNWCEGLATYVADYLLKERASANEARDYRFKLLSDYATLVDMDNDFPLTDFRSRSSKPEQAVGYGKTAMVFHMLRQKIGDELFWKGLRQIAAQQRGKKTGWNDLERIFSKVSGHPLEDFFRQWIASPGAPVLTLENVDSVPTPHGWRITGMLAQQTETPYTFGLQLALQNKDTVVTQDLAISGTQTPFQIDSVSAPVSLKADPDHHLFRRLAVNELPLTINSLRASGQPLVVLADGYGQEWLTASSDLLRGLQWHRAPVIAERDLSATQQEHNDLLVIGWPGSSALLDCLTADVAYAEQGFKIDGQSFKNAEDALFVTRGKTGNCRGALGIFLPMSPQAATLVARKIPHYGRYSDLVFAKGQNVLKQTRDVATSPVRYDFEVQE